MTPVVVANNRTGHPSPKSPVESLRSKKLRGQGSARAQQQSKGNKDGFHK